MFYCPLHHWNKTAIIPARIICNWQFEKKSVSQASYQLLNYKYKSKMYDLEKLNPKLFTYLESLGQIKVRNNTNDLFCNLRLIEPTVNFIFTEYQKQFGQNEKVLGLVQSMERTVKTLIIQVSRIAI